MSRTNPTASKFDLKSRDFDVDAYLSYQLKQKTLDELVKEEEEMVNSVRRLDSDIHQIVYENYNKFLTATNTVRKIQEEFADLETEMTTLGSSMKHIQSLIDNMGDVLGGRRDDVTQLANSYRAVKSVQFIFELPATMQGYLDNRQFVDLIRVYLLARKSLSTYGDLDNVAQVLAKCEDIVKEAETELRSRVAIGHIEHTEQVEEAVNLLGQLNIPRDELQGSFLAAAVTSLRSDLEGLETDVEDVLDLVDRGCGTFLPNLTLIATLHEKLFADKKVELLQCLCALISDFHSTVRKLFLSSTDPKDCSIVVRALDRYYRKMSACSQLLSGLDFSEQCVQIIKEVSQHQMSISRAKILSQVEAAVKELRETVLEDDVDLAACVSKLEHALVFNVKTALANLLLFSASDVTFSALPASVFQADFAVAVHEELLVAAFGDLAQSVAKFATVDSETRFVSPLFLLVVAVSLYHIATKSAHYLMRLCEEQFSLAEKKDAALDKLRTIVSRLHHHHDDIPAPIFRNKNLTLVDTVAGRLKDTAQAVIKRFCDQKGIAIGEGVAKAVENGSLTSAAPVGVRAAVRTAADELHECDRLLSSLLSGENRKEPRNIRTPRPPQEAMQHDTLWSERVDFHQPIHFNRSSIMSAIVKVFLKTFIEIIRLQTFGKHAVEQVQVDCYFLQRHLAQLVSDEVVVNSLTDQALSAALKRSLDPVLLHPTQLVRLCEQGSES